MSTVLKKIKTLFIGNTLAQVITVLSIPLITRLYEPVSFADLAVISALVIILSNISSLRLDLIIPLSKDEEVNNLALFGIFFSFILNILVFLFISLIKLKLIYLFIPLSSFLLSVYLILNAINVKRGDFKNVNKLKLIQSINMNLGQILFGCMNLKDIGLILGYSLQNAFIMHYSLKFFNKNYILKSFDYIRKKIIFLKYSILESFFNNLSNQLPVVILSAYIINKSEIGMISMSMKILSIPIIFIGNAFSTLYLSEGPKYLKNKPDFYKYTLKTLKLISLLTILPLVLGSMFLGAFDHLLLGEEWRDLGNYLTLLLPWYIMQLLSSPISTSMHMLGLQKKALYIHFLGFMIRVIMLLLIIEFYNEMAIKYFVISGFIFYFLFFIYIIFSLRNVCFEKNVNSCL